MKTKKGRKVYFSENLFTNKIGIMRGSTKLTNIYKPLNITSEQLKEIMKNI